MILCELGGGGSHSLGRKGFPGVLERVSEYSPDCLDASWNTWVRKPLLPTWVLLMTNVFILLQVSAVTVVILLPYMFYVENLKSSFSANKLFSVKP